MQFHFRFGVMHMDCCDCVCVCVSAWFNLQLVYVILFSLYIPHGYATNKIHVNEKIMQRDMQRPMLEQGTVKVCGVKKGARKKAQNT